jgi:hypothetical protein
MNGSGKLASAVLILFSLPFLGFGAFAFFMGLQKLVAGAPAQNWVFALFGLFFFAIGAALMGGAILGPAKMKQAEQRRAEHPQEPWLWRNDWAEGYVKSTRKSNLISKCVFAALWTLVSLPVVFLVPKETIQQRPVVAVAFLFPAIGVFLIIVAFREILRRVEFGNTSLQLASVPCVIGREFRGAIHARFPHSPDHGVRLKLTCVQRITTGSGKDQNTSEKILWRDELNLSGAELYPAPTGTSIPVSFLVPAEAISADSSHPRNQIIWLLTAEADVPGVDYKDSFELPVFRTASSPAVSQDEARPIEAPERPTIVVRPAGNGGTEFYFPAGRNPGFATSTTAFSTAFGAMIWFMLAHHIPFIFPLVFSLFDLILVYASVQLWVGTSTVVIGAGVVRLRSGVLGGGKVQEIQAAQVTSIQAVISGQQGGAAGTPYYDIQFWLADDRKVIAGKTVRDKHEVEWLVSEMKRLIGLGKPKTMAAGAR